MRIIVSGGGTGGHIYPALALIERLKQVEPDTQVLYVGTDRGLENKIVPAAGLELKVLHTQGFKRSLSLENFKTAYLFLKAVHDAKKIIRVAMSAAPFCMRQPNCTYQRLSMNKTALSVLPINF